STAPSTPHIHTLSLHDALPISSRGSALAALSPFSRPAARIELRLDSDGAGPLAPLFELLDAVPETSDLVAEFMLRDDAIRQLPRSEEHTSELQSRFDLVCRLLL